MGVSGRGAPKVRRFSPARKIGSFPRLAPAIRHRRIAVHARCASVCLSPPHRPCAPHLFNATFRVLYGKEDRATRREPRSLEAAGAHGLGVSRKSDWGGSREKQIGCIHPPVRHFTHILFLEVPSKFGMNCNNCIIFNMITALNRAHLDWHESCKYRKSYDYQHAANPRPG
jgi:hypothetical protein